jgi:hypothetical protein
MLQKSYAKPARTKLNRRDVSLILDSLQYVSLELSDKDAHDPRIKTLRELMGKILRMHDGN